MTGNADPLAAVRRHLQAFNARDLDALLDGFDDDAVFATSEQLVVGKHALRRLFGDSFVLPPRARLELKHAVADDKAVACELVEEIETEGVFHTLEIAAFYQVSGGLITRVRIYRELVP